jgi:AraC-like DNA-binding protein
MHVAAGLLLDGTGNIGTVASRVGYRSEAAFSIAFKRWAGTPQPISRDNASWLNREN